MASIFRLNLASILPVLGLQRRFCCSRCRCNHQIESLFCSTQVKRRFLPSVGGSFAAAWARMVLKKCSSERWGRANLFSFSNCINPSVPPPPTPSIALLTALLKLEMPFFNCSIIDIAPLEPPPEPPPVSFVSDMASAATSAITAVSVKSNPPPVSASSSLPSLLCETVAVIAFASSFITFAESPPVADEIILLVAAICMATLAALLFSSFIKSRSKSAGSSPSEAATC